MRILCYGAGVIGSVLSVRLARAGHDVTVVDRGERLDQVRRDGLVIRDGISGVVERASVAVAPSLGPDDPYDLALVPVRIEHADAILPVLAANRRIPTIAMMVSNARGYDDWVRVLGDRLVIAFPGLGGGRIGSEVRYVFAPPAVQRCSFGEPGGGVSRRVRDLAAAFEAAGIPSAVYGDIGAWQRTHVAWVSPAASALLAAGGAGTALAERPELVRRWVRAVRQNLAVLDALGVPVTPARLGAWRWVPEGVLSASLVRLARSDFFRWAAVAHTVTGPIEMDRLYREFRTLADRAGVSTPEADALAEEARARVQAGDVPDGLSAAFPDLATA